MQIGPLYHMIDSLMQLLNYAEFAIPSGFVFQYTIGSLCYPQHKTDTEYNKAMAAAQSGTKLCCLA